MNFDFYIYPTISGLLCSINGVRARTSDLNFTTWEKIIAGLQDYGVVPAIPSISMEKVCIREGKNRGRSEQKTRGKEIEKRKT